MALQLSFHGKTIAQPREWGCRITWSISDVSRTPFIGQMRLVINYMSSWDVLCKLDLYSVAMLSFPNPDWWLKDGERTDFFVYRSRLHPAYERKRMCAHIRPAEGSSRQIMNHRHIPFSYVHEPTHRCPSLSTMPFLPSCIQKRLKNEIALVICYCHPSKRKILAIMRLEI